MCKTSDRHLSVVTGAIARRLTTTEDIQHAQRLRYQVWKEEGVMLCRDGRESIDDKHDDHGLHWGVFEDGRLIAAARLCMHHLMKAVPDSHMFESVQLPVPAASMNRLVVLDEYRGCGIGKMLDLGRIKEAERLGARAIIATPVDPEPRRRQLSRLGFRFLDGIIGCPPWSPSVRIAACYKLLSSDETRA